MSERNAPVPPKAATLSAEPSAEQVATEPALTGDAMKSDAVMGAAVEAQRSDLPPAAQRALAEAEERRRKSAALDFPPELGGRDGPEPVRYGDYEKNGLAVDF